MLVRFLSVCAVSLALSLPASAAGLALIIANEDYETLRDARGAGQVLAAETRLRAAGFDVETTSDLSAAEIRGALSRLSRNLRQQQRERVVIVFAGHMLHGEQGVWLMGTEAESPDLATMDNDGVRLETVLSVASRIQGGAVVALAEGSFPGSPGDGLTGGLPDRIDVPQGVSLVRGPVGQITAFVREAMVPGTNLGGVVRQTRTLSIEGFDPPFLTFLPEGFEPAQEADRRAWAEAEDADTVEAYDAYLEAFPSGGFVEAARSAIEALETTPETIEDALGLTRDERRAIQRDLTLLGFNTRGIDGIFGPGTRGSIRLWQAQNGYEDTGFITRDQIFQLNAQAARRAAEIEAEERERRAAEEQRDRVFWAETGAAGDEAGLRAYLNRYPQGIFAELARERIGSIEAERARARAERERAAWADARAIDSIAAYESFLADWPEGDNAASARSRLEELREAARPAPEPQPDPGVSPELVERDRDAEQALALGQMTRVLIERQLRGEGYDPGAVDGSFDANTRAALADWQEDNGMTPTGYVTSAVIDGLIRGAVFRLFD